MIYYIAEFDFGGQKVEVSKRNLLSLSGGILSTGDIQLPYYGVISNSGSCSFIDSFVEDGVRKHKVIELLESGFAYEKIPTKLYLYNSLTKNKWQFGQYFAQNAEYDYATNTSTFSLDDGLTEWQNIPIDDSAIKSRASLYSVYQAASSTATEQTGFEFDELDYDTRTKLSSIRPYYSNDGMAKNYWAYFDNICKAGLCQMYVGANGKVKLVRGV